MKRILQITFTVAFVFLLNGCDFIKNTFEYKDTAKDFVEYLIKEDYNKGFELMAMEHETAKNVNLDTLKMGLARVREGVVENFGTELEYTFMTSQKTFYSNIPNSASPNTTTVSMEIKNSNYFGVVNVLFDDNSKKILNINLLEIRLPIPTMTYFWLFGALAICIPIFNIYVIVQIKRSNLTKKWLKYIAIICLNVPAISYNAVNGLSFKLINFQILSGVSFFSGGFLNSYWSFGIPLGGLYWFWKLRQRKEQIELERKREEIAKKYNVTTEIESAISQ